MNRETSIYYSIYIVAFFVILSLVILAARSNIHITPAPSVRYNAHQCLTGTNNHAGILQVLVYTEASAIKLADALCENLVVKRNYHKVRVVWDYRDRDELKIIFDQRFGLLISKPELIERPEIDLTDHYLPIATYEDYNSQLISLDSLPELTEKYLRGKKLGLMKKPTSLSGHKIPRQMIKNAGINEQLLDIHYFHSHVSLYQGLLNGKVDLIGTTSLINSPKTLFRLPLKTGLKGLRWYLHPNLNNTDLHCQIISILKITSVESDVIYKQSLKILKQCHH